MIVIVIVNVNEVLIDLGKKNGDNDGGDGDDGCHVIFWKTCLADRAYSKKVIKRKKENVE